MRQTMCTYLFHLYFFKALPISKYRFPPRQTCKVLYPTITRELFINYVIIFKGGGRFVYQWDKVFKNAKNMIQIDFTSPVAFGLGAIFILHNCVFGLLQTTHLTL